MIDDSENEFVPWRFHGKASEYFGIWLSNLLLSIITLGIFSAWAKVRRNRYFLGNTEIAGSVLQYHATGGKILIGRIIAMAILLVYSNIGYYATHLYVIFMLILAVVLPWILDRGMAFRCRVVSWHNIHFRWMGNYRIAMKGMLPLLIAFLPSFLLSVWYSAEIETVMSEMEAPNPSVGYLLAAFVFALCLYPWAARTMAQMVVNHIAWGSLRLKNTVSLQRYALRVLVYLYLGLGLGYGIGVATVTFLLIHDDAVINGPDFLFEWFLPMILFFIVVVIPLYAAFRGMIRDLILNSTHAIDQQNTCEAVYMHARYCWRHLLWIKVSNLILSIVSLSLLVPWAKIRYERYLIGNTATTFTQNLESMVDQQQEHASAMASEYADLDGFDFDPW
ncbi:MAG: DUF898 domain-containing protein [Alphaproteobacteria bacterium]|nr:DUF898 domain-containing protein [Alphaproteobacteria bacterium]